MPEAKVAHCRVKWLPECRWLSPKGPHPLQAGEQLQGGLSSLFPHPTEVSQRATAYYPGMNTTLSWPGRGALPDSSA